MTAPAGGLALHVECTLSASPSHVFEACVVPAQLAEWWGPAGFTSPGIDLDVRVGGRYRIAMQPPDGALFHLRGEYVDVDPPQRLAYTFEWEEPDPDDQETVVRLAFEPRGDDTQMTLDQGPFKTEARFDLHRRGWSESFVRLERHLAQPPPDG